MRYCVKCCMSDQRPGITFNEEGVCRPCQVAEERKSIDWDARKTELVELVNKHFRKGAGYDCIITVSGGKDSHFQTHIMKECFDMNPLLLNVYNYSWTKTGMHNFLNMSEAFGCDIMSMVLNRKTAKTMTRVCFERWGKPTLYWDRAVYAWPIQMAVKLGIKLIVYGENISYEYGGAQGETPYAYEQINNEATNPIDPEAWEDYDLDPEDFQALNYPSKEEIKESGIEPIYLSYFMKWDGKRNMEVAKKYGFRTLEWEGWNREGYIEQYDQIDTAGYLVHPWLKYPKFGHARATDVSCYWIRTGRITREQGVEFVREHDHKLDQRVLDDFLAFTGYTQRQFWEIVDKWYNPKLFTKDDDNLWKLKWPVWELPGGIEVE